MGPEKLSVRSRLTRDGGLWLFFVASCLSNQFDLLGKRYAFSRI